MEEIEGAEEPRTVEYEPPDIRSGIRYTTGRVEPKLVHHRCGYPLLVQPALQANSSVLVVYWDVTGTGIAVFMCPRCYGELKLWWETDTLVVPPRSADGV